jgi:hypothetical protein
LKRVLNNDEYTITWVSGSITGLDFSTTDNKRCLKMSVDNNTIQGDGVSIATLTFQVLKPDQSGTANNYSQSILISVNPPQRNTYFTQVAIVNGVATKTFDTANPGRWVFGEQVKGLRLSGNPVIIDVYGVGVLN